MRLATITNWAYGATVGLTLISGTTMLLASRAQEQERAAVEQRYRFDQATGNLGTFVFTLTDQARQYVITGDPGHLAAYQRGAQGLGSVEDRIRHVRDAGAGADEMNALGAAVRLSDGLHDEQRAALAARQRGDDAGARRILFGAAYERELDRVQAMIERFQYRLDQRTGAELDAATAVARLWKAVSEVVLAITGILFLCVLYFVFKRRVLRPVVRLSDVVTRLAAQDYTAEAPEEGQIDEIGDMAHAIGVFRDNAIERQRLEAERDADRMMRDLLSRMTQRMQGCDSLLQLKDVIQRFVPQIVPGLAGRLYLFDEPRNLVVEACNWLAPVHSRTEFPPATCWALRRGLPHRPAGKAVDVPCDHLALGDAPLIDSICLPLTAQRETLGLLYFEPLTGGSGNETETPEIYLHMLAENIGLALSNLRLRDALREMAMADPLTGLANRRQLEAVLDLRLTEARRLGQPVSCLMLDVDHFKHFNDKFGHDAGDEVLREVAGALRQLVREQCLASRYGGEEFLVLMPGVGPDQAAVRAEEVRARIGALRVESKGSELGPVTVSIGVATTPDHCLPQSLVQTADAALLRAKSRGRDRVEVAVARKPVARKSIGAL